MPKTITTEIVSAQRLHPKARLQSEADIKKLVSEAVAALEQYEAQTLLLHDMLNPDAAVVALKKEIQAAKSGAELSDLQMKIAAINGSKIEAKQRAMSLARPAYEPARAAIAKLLSKAEAVLADYIVEAETAEELFYSQFGLPRQATQVSNRIADTLSTVRAFQAGLKEYHGDMLMPTTSNALDFLKAS